MRISIDLDNRRSSGAGTIPADQCNSHQSRAARTKVHSRKLSHAEHPSQATEATPKRHPSKHSVAKDSDGPPTKIMFKNMKPVKSARSFVTLEQIIKDHETKAASVTKKQVSNSSPKKIPDPHPAAFSFAPAKSSICKTHETQRTRKLESQHPLDGTSFTFPFQVMTQQTKHHVAEDRNGKNTEVFAKRHEVFREKRPNKNLHDLMQQIRSKHDPSREKAGLSGYESHQTEPSASNPQLCIARPVKTMPQNRRSSEQEAKGSQEHQLATLTDIPQATQIELASISLDQEFLRLSAVGHQQEEAESQPLSTSLCRDCSMLDVLRRITDES